MALLFTFPSGILGQVWYLIVAFPDLAVFRTFTNLALCYDPSNLRSHTGSQHPIHIYYVTYENVFTCKMMAWNS